MLDRLPGEVHNTKAARAQGAFGQHSQAQCGIVGVPSAGPGVGLDAPDRSNSAYSMIL